MCRLLQLLPLWTPPGVAAVNTGVEFVTIVPMDANVTANAIRTIIAVVITRASARALPRLRRRPQRRQRQRRIASPQAHTSFRTYHKSQRRAAPQPARAAALQHQDVLTSPSGLMEAATFRLPMLHHSRQAANMLEWCRAQMLAQQLPRQCQFYSRAGVAALMIRQMQFARRLLFGVQAAASMIRMLPRGSLI